jgi:hypothetical protein
MTSVAMGLGFGRGCFGREGVQRCTGSFADSGGGQECFPGNRGLHLIQEALPTRPLFGVDQLVVREAQLEGGGHPFQSQSWIWIDFSGFFRCSLNMES